MSVGNIALELRPYLEKVSQWRADTRVLADVALQAKSISPSALLRVEEIAGEIRDTIRQLGEATRDFGHMSELDRTLLIEVEEGLRLVLLEITELSTKLYPLAADHVSSTAG